jgi:hypothetical protein
VRENQAELVKMLQQRKKVSEEVLSVLDAGLSVGSDPATMRIATTTELNKNLARFTPWCSMHQCTSALTRGVRAVH